MSKKVKCDFCTDKGHCPEYIPGAPCILDRRVNTNPDGTSKWRTADLIKAAVDIAKDHNAQYAEDAVKILLRDREITVDQYCAVMKALYK